MIIVLRMTCEHHWLCYNIHRARTTIVTLHVASKGYNNGGCLDEEEADKIGSQGFCNKNSGTKLTLLHLTLKEKLETISIQRSLTWEEDAKLTDEIEWADTYKETIFSALKADKLFKDTPTTQSPSAPATSPPAYSHSYSQWHFPSFNWDATMRTWLHVSGPVSGSRLKQLMTVILISREPRSSTTCSVLEDAAREAITGLMLTEANYWEAVATLMKRFGGTEQIVSRHMEALLQVEALSESATFVRQQQLSHKKPCFIGSEGGDVRRPPVPLASFPVPRLQATKSWAWDWEWGYCAQQDPADLQLTVSKVVPEAEWKLTTPLATIEEEIVARERPGWSKAPRRGEDKSPSTATTYPCDERTFCYPNLLLL